MGMSMVRTRGMRLRSAMAAVAVLGLVLATGCGGGDTVKTIEGEGTVTLDGAPLADAQVEFQPADKSSPSYGTTDASGHYVLMFTADQPGVVPGEHKVRITTEGEKDDGKGNMVPIEETLPEKYNANTELTVVVEAGGGPYNFELTSE